MQIGDILKKRREERVETLEDVAFRAGTDASNLSRIERGLQQPSITLLDGLAQALGCRVSELYVELEAQVKGTAVQDPREPWSHDLMRLQRHFRELDTAHRQLLIDMAKVLKKY